MTRARAGAAVALALAAAACAGSPGATRAATPGDTVLLQVLSAGRWATPAPTTPVAITILGLEPVYRLNLTGAGLSGPLTNTPASHAQACAGCSLDVDGIGFHITANNVLANWDFTGYQVFEDGDITVECDNCRLKNRADRGFALGGSQNSTTNPTWKCVNCYVDGTLFPVASGEGPVKWSGGGDETWISTYWTDSTRDMISHGGTGKLTVSWNYFKGVCLGVAGSGGGAHCEPAHMGAGSCAVDHTLVDFRGTGGRETASITGMWYPQAVNGPVACTFDRDVFLAALEPSTIPNCHLQDPDCTDYTGGLPWTFQTAPGFGSMPGTPVGNVNFTITNSALSRGWKGYFAATDAPYAPYVTTLVASGNYDVDTGVALGSALP